MKRASPGIALALALAAATGLAACQGCQTPTVATPVVDAAAQGPNLRLFVLSTVAGTLEPCGCSKDQLGGVDHLAAFIAKEKAGATSSLVVGAGPMLFLDPTLKQDQSTQDKWKAEAIAQAAKDIGLAAWAPGANDWAAGAQALGGYREQASAALVAANLTGVPGAVPSIVVDAGGVKVGIVGVSDPAGGGGAPLPPGVQTAPAEAAMRAALADLKKQGATILVGLAALPRGEALRLADNLPELHVLVVGKPSSRGEGNDGQKSPVIAGTTLVVETSNHLQTVGVVDLFVRGGPSGPIVFADAGGVAKGDELLSLSNRIRDLETRINSWEKNQTVKTEDIAARKADLEKLRAEKAKLEVVEPPAEGSFFRYSTVEVREKLGSDASVAARMLAYYKRVNEHNRTAFADRKPPPAEPGQASYLGVEACTECHDEERKVWDATAHARAYETLEKGFKEFNLDCVSCHVTGYGKPGGSTVTFNEKLKDVGCEECHGPGSLHAKKPSDKKLIILKPEPQSCVSQCHHPPHVEGFDPVGKMKLVLGVGHGPDPAPGSPSP